MIRSDWDELFANDDGRFIGIVEEKDSTDSQREILEVNMSYCLFRCLDLVGVFGKLPQTIIKTNITSPTRQACYFLREKRSTRSPYYIRLNR
jgi:hypothetical protein